MTTPAPTGSDKTTLWGVLGIIFALCCPVVGIIFSVLSLLESKKYNTSPVLAYVGFVIAGLNILSGIILTATGTLSIV